MTVSDINQQARSDTESPMLYNAASSWLVYAQATHSYNSCHGGEDRERRENQLLNTTLTQDTEMGCLTYPVIQRQDMPLAPKTTLPIL